MAVAPFELESVLADELDFPKLEIVWNVNGKDQPDSGHFIFASSAGAHASKWRREVVGFVSVGPLNHQLARSDFLNFSWGCRLRAGGIRHEELLHLEHRRFVTADADLRRDLFGDAAQDA